MEDDDVDASAYWGFKIRKLNIFVKLHSRGMID